MIGMLAVMDLSTLTREDRCKALSSLLFLKEKRCGKIKGQACINGVLRGAYIPKKDAVPPTVSTKLVSITSLGAASKKGMRSATTFLACLLTHM